MPIVELDSSENELNIAEEEVLPSTTQIPVVIEEVNAELDPSIPSEECIDNVDKSSYDSASPEISLDECTEADTTPEDYGEPEINEECPEPEASAESPTPETPEEYPEPEIPDEYPEPEIPEEYPEPEIPEEYLEPVIPEENPEPYIPEDCQEPNLPEYLPEPEILEEY